MATLDQLENALRNADAAGDIEAARMIASEIKKMQAPKPMSTGDRVARVGKSMLRDVIQGAGELGGIVYNPVAYGVGQVTGRGYTPLAEQAKEATQRMGLPEPSTPAERISSAGSRAVVGAGGMMGIGKTLGTQAPAIANFLTAQPASQIGGAAGSGLFGQTAKELNAPVPVQIAASLAGGYGGARAGGLFDQSSVPTQAAELVRAYEKAGVEPSMAPITENVVTKRVAQGVGSVPVVGSPLAKRSAKMLDQVDDAIKNAQGTKGLEPEAFGGVLQQAAKRTMERSRKLAGMLYDRATSKVPEGTTIVPQKTIAQIDEAMGELATFPGINKGIVDELSIIRSDLVDENGVARAFTAQQMRDLRSTLNRALGNPEIRSDKITALRRSIPASLTDDISTALADNPSAIGAYRRADDFWKYHVDKIDTALTKILGKNKDSLSPEVAAANFMNMAKPRGDASRLRSIMNDLDPSEAQEVRASIIDTLGKVGDRFSPAQFSTAYGKMTPAAKAAMFGDMKSKMDNLAKVAESVGAYQRFAPTGSAPVQIAGLTTGAVTAAVNPQTMAAVAPVLGGSYLTAKLMASPTFVKWMADYVKSPTPEVMSRLAVLAADDPEIAKFMENLNGTQ